ncbi:MAG: IS4 family transposase [Methylovulum miyakonense]|uniref:IS4 family transposase n=1 Tax=Methylovulum miyakonense TaxID=645578 RepID=UPI003BB7B76C
MTWCSTPKNGRPPGWWRTGKSRRRNRHRLGEMVRLVARLGGFLGRKSDGKPGPKAIWEGMEKVRQYAVGIEVGKAVYAT